MLYEEKNKHVFRNFCTSGTFIIDILQMIKGRGEQTKMKEKCPKLLVSHMILLFDFTK